ncbi:hypothetical protein ACQ1Z2_15730, partial [Enterococcus faecalis]|uniref:hypothetical protein n=1 Tax=Enterococcus faecalis TaxID=1351 RepID=UPI003D6C6AEA
LAYKQGYQAGVLARRKEATPQALEKREVMIVHELKEYQKNSILKHCYEETIEINYFDDKIPLKVQRALDRFGSRTVQFGILGQF